MSEADADGRVERARAQREQRRRLILDTAVRVFSEQGYHRTRVSDIVEAAGIARGTFYLYFDSKNGIFLELLDELLAHLRSSVVGADTSADAPPLPQQIQGTLERLLGTVAANRALTTIILREAVGLDAEADAKLHEFYDSLHAMLVQSLRNGRAMGALRDLDDHVVATCILGSIRQVLYRYLVREPASPVDIERTARAVLDYNLYGLMRR